jgi:signal peptidase II
LKKTDSKTSAAQSDKSNGVSLSRYAVFIFLMVAGAAADLISKQLIFSKYFHANARVPITHWWIDGCLGIETTTNQGALWGHGQGMQFWFAGLSVLAFIAIIYWLFVRRAATSWVLTIALGLISGGIFGNLYDRLGLWHGADIAANHAYGVRDWIHFRWTDAPGFLQNIFNPWPNFNIADSVLVCGAVLLVVHALFFPVQSPAEPRENAAKSDET